MKRLTRKKIASVNQIVSKAQVLINVRGLHNGMQGRYEGNGFVITFVDAGETAELLISHHGRGVLKTTWAGDDAAHVVQAAGSWPDALLALPAAHA